MNTTFIERIDTVLDKRKAAGTLRKLPCFHECQDVLNLANNDYLGLAKHPKVIAAAQEALERYGTSASASPLVTGFGEAHEALLTTLRQWYGRPHGLLWNSGYAANVAVLGCLPNRGDAVLADRLIHHSMIQGILRSGARLIRYPHADVDALEALLAQTKGRYAQRFVVTESVFSMDGNAPDLPAIVALKKQHDFLWVLDEAHAIGWYGTNGCGLAEKCGTLNAVDVLVGTLGKGLGSMGAFTLFHDARLENYLLQVAGEFIYSTYLPPSCAAAAHKAIEIVQNLRKDRAEAHAISQYLRKRLHERGFDVPGGDSPIVPVRIGEAQRTMDIARKLEGHGILLGAIRPPTVPENSSRLRLSLRLHFSPEQQAHLLKAFEEVAS